MEIAAIYQVIQLAVLVVTSGIAIYKGIKAKQWKQSAVITEQALAAVAAAIEMLPASETKAKLKVRIEQISKLIGTEGPVLAELVQDVSEALKAAGLVGHGQRDDDVVNAVAALGKVREMRAAKKAGE